MNNAEWQVIVCPDCLGKKGTTYRDYDGREFVKCHTCNEKGIVRVHIDNIDKLEEFIP